MFIWNGQGAIPGRRPFKFNSIKSYKTQKTAAYGKEHLNKRTNNQ
jgi:hypothetical protein